MRWFRNNGRTGAWLALLALTINLALSFGHLHLHGTRADQTATKLTAFSALPHDAGRPAEPGNHPDDLCPICMASASIASAVISTPPALPVDFAFVVLDQTIEHQPLTAQPRRGAFQPRGPPLS